MTRAHAAAFAALFGASSALAPAMPAAFAPVAGAAARAAAALSGGIPVGNPTAVGMSAERLAAVDRVVQSGIAAGGFPGASVVVGRNGYAVVKRGYGRQSWGETSPRVDEQTVYDLASLTKVVATTSALMVLYDEGKLDLDAPVSTYLPEFSGGLKDQVTVRMLLTHRSGLSAGRDLWRTASSPAEARRQVLEAPLVCAPNACFEYSDLGADVLGFVAEAVSGQPLDEFVEDQVFGPLGMNDTHFLPGPEYRERTAPTEVAPPRGYPLRGEVHDENAYALGGVAGHAGLFSTAADLSIFAQTLVDGGAYRGVRVFETNTVALFTRRAFSSVGAGGTRALGWDTCDQGGSCGRMMGATSYGHTGFTGTSLWIDPDRRMFVVLLTNRVHDARAARPARVIGDVRADLADAAELAVLDDPNGVRAMPASFRADAEAGWHRPRVTVRSARAKAAKSRVAARRAKAARARKSRSSASAKAVRGKATSARAGAKTSSKARAKSTAKGSKTTSRAKATAAKGAAKKAPAKSSRSAKRR